MERLQAPSKAGAFGGLTEVTVITALAALLLFRLIALYFNRTELFFDEAQYWSWGQEPAFGYYSKPPLIAWIIGATTSLCGDSTFCVRLPAPILHTVTALVIYALGCRMINGTVGAIASLTFATLPGISLSAGIISTDVPLLLCWAVALLGYVELIDTARWRPAIVLGLALGAGLNAKYAMIFFLASVTVHMAVAPRARQLLRDKRFWAALAIGGLFILPNMAWNLSNSFATFAHTADNAKWSGTLLNIAKGLEFAGAQLGVFGPILFGALVLIVIRAWHEGLPEAEKLLLAFTLPVLLLITVQAFVSRAHANWAAVAYVAGSVLVTAVLVRLAEERWLRASFALHLLVLALLSAGTAAAGRFSLPVVGDPFQRLLGWKGLAAETQRTLELARAAGTPYQAVFTDDRSITAELLYYMRDEPTPVRAWREDGRPRDHYELTRPFKDPAQVPALLVSVRRDAQPITRRFSKAELIGERDIPAGLGEMRHIRLFRLSGLRSD